MTAINIKVYFPTEQSKVFRVPVKSTIRDLLLQIQQKLNELHVDNGPNYGLFQRASKNKTAHWLNPNRLIKYYNLTNESEVEYKKKYRVLRVSLLDNSVYCLIIDSSKKIKKIIAHIGSKLKLQDYDQYGLKRLNKESRWLNMEKTFYDEEIPEDECLIFLKRLFANDYDIDMEDKFQLHLIYIQAKENFVSGEFNPLHRIEIIDLASTLLQVIHGNYDPKKRFPESLIVEKVLPPNYRKDKKIIKDLYKEWSKLSGYSEIKAKFRFVRFARSLKKYGTSFYEVTEKQKNKNVRFILGINHEKIMKLNKETRKIVKEWNIEQLHRWSFSRNFFTLDFGEYESDYIVIKTDKAEEMSHLISGYISIILKTRTKHEHVEEKDTLESNVDNISYTSGYAINAMRKFLKISDTDYSFPQTSVVCQSQLPFPQAQVLAVGDLSSAINASKILSIDMQNGLDDYKSSGAISCDQWRGQLRNYNSELIEDVKKFLEHIKSGKRDMNMIDSISRSIYNNVLGLGVASKNIASMETDLSIIDVAKNVNDSIKEILERGDVKIKSPVLSELKEVENYFNINNDVLKYAIENKYADKGSEVLMSAWAENLNYTVNDAIGSFLDGVLSELECPLVKSHLVSEFTNLKSSLNWAVKCLKCLIPVIAQPRIRDLFRDLCTSLYDSFSLLMKSIQKLEISDENRVKLDQNFEYLDDSLEMINKSLESTELRVSNDSIDLEGPSKSLISILSSISAGIDNPKELTDCSNQLINSSNKLIKRSNALSKFFDDGKKNYLITTTKNMNECCQKLSETIQNLNENPYDKKNKDHIKELVSRIEFYNQDINSKVGCHAAYLALRYGSKIATAKMIKVQALSRHLASIVSNMDAKKALIKSEDILVENMKEMVSATHLVVKNSEDVSFNENFLNVNKGCLLCYQNSIMTLKQIQSFVSDITMKNDIKYASDEASDAVMELENLCIFVSNLHNEKEIDESIIKFEIARADLNYAELMISRGLLTASSGVNRENALELLHLTIRNLNISLDGLVVLSKKGGNLHVQIQEISDKVNQLVIATRSIASVISDCEIQKVVIVSTRNVLNDIFQLICSSRVFVSNQKDEGLLKNVNKDHVRVKSTIASLLAAAKGVNTSELDRAIQIIKADKAKLGDCLFEDAVSGQTIESLVSVTKALSAAIFDFIKTAKDNPCGIDNAVATVISTMVPFLRLSSTVYNFSADKSTSERIFSAINSLTDIVLEVIETVKKVIANRDAASIETLNNLNNRISDSVKHFLTALGSFTYSECEEAIGSINESIQELDIKTPCEEIIIPTQLFDNLESKSQALMAITRRMVTASRISTEKLGLYSKETANLYKSLVNSELALLSQSNSVDSTASFVTSCISELRKCCSFLLIYSDVNIGPQMVKKAYVAVSKLVSFSNKISGDLDALKKYSEKNEILKMSENIGRDIQVLTEAAQSAVAKSDADSLRALSNSAREMNQDICGFEQSLASITGFIKKDNIDYKVIQDVLDATKHIGNKYIALIRASINVNVNKEDEEASNQLIEVTNKLTSAISQLVTAYSSINPGYQVLKNFENFLQSQLEIVEMQSVSVAMGKPIQLSHPSLTYSGVKNLLCDSTKSIARQLSKLCTIIRVESFKMTSTIQDFHKSIAIFIQNSSDAVATSPTQQNKMQHLSYTKSLLEFLSAAIQAGELTTKQDYNSIENFNTYIEKSAEVLSHILGMLESNESVAADITEILNQVKSQIKRVDDILDPKEVSNRRYNDLYDELTENLSPILIEQINRFTRTGVEIGSIGLNSARLGESLDKWINIIQAVITKSRKNEQVSERINICAKEFLNTIVVLLEHAKIYVGNPNESSFKNLQNSSPEVLKKLTELLNAVKLGALGEIECDQAIDVINQLLVQISNNSISAQAGQLKPKEYDTLTPKILQEQIVQFSHDLIHKVADLGQNSKSSREFIGKMTLIMANQFQNIADYTIKFARHLADSNLQLALLGSLKMAGIRFQQFIIATRDAERNRDDHTAQQSSLVSEQKMKESINNLIDIIRSSASKSTAGERQIESTRQKIINFLQNIPGYDSANSDDIISASQESLKSITQLVFAQNQEEVIMAALNIQDCIEKLANSAVTIVKNAPDDIQMDVKKSLDKVGSSLCHLLNKDKIGHQDHLENTCGEVTTSIQNLVKSLRHVPQLEEFSFNETRELEILANSELRTCAKIVEEAAAMLIVKKPGLVDHKDPHNIEKKGIYNSIFEAVIEIVEATKLLMTTSASIQQESSPSKMSKTGRCYHNDPTWANGLISACKGVADSVKQLVRAANDVSLGQLDQEVLVVSARMTAAATAQLVAASRVKTSPRSSSQTKLKQGSKAITSATKKLVVAAQKAAQLDKDIEFDTSKDETLEFSKKAKFDQQIRILKLEAEIEKERRRLAIMNKMEYGH